MKEKEEKGKRRQKHRAKCTNLTVCIFECGQKWVIILIMIMRLDTIISYLCCQCFFNFEFSSSSTITQFWILISKNTQKKREKKKKKKKKCTQQQSTD